MENSLVGFYWSLPRTQGLLFGASPLAEKDPGCSSSRVYNQKYSFREGRPFQSPHVLTCNLMLLFIKEVLK